MDKALKHLLLGTTVSIMAFGVFANDTSHSHGSRADHALMDDHHHKRMDPTEVREKMARHQAELRQKLNLSPAQETAWNAYAASITLPERSEHLKRPDWDKLTTPQRLERKLQHMQQKEARMSIQLHTMQALYDQLTPGQRTIFDENTKMGRKRR